jgi:hypothetical protein
MQNTVVPIDVDELLASGSRPHEEVLDDVYRKYADSHPFRPITHFVDHSTMGPEALVGLGLGDRVEEWIARHAVRPYEAPSTGLPLPSVWRQAVGRQDCHGDWLRYFESELNAGPFEPVLGRWIERFAPGAGALLFHGLIRTAHAARALEHKDTPARRGELARGLALWAIGIKSLPEEATNRDAVDDPKTEIMNCARAGAATFLRRSTIPNLHLVTGPMAYLMIAHHLDSGVHRLAAGAFRQTHARSIGDFDSDNKAALSISMPVLDRSHFAPLVESSDAHPVKLTEAALRAYRSTGDDLFLKAAGRVQNYNFWRALVG